MIATSLENKNILNMDEFIHNNNENCITNNDFNAPDRKNEFMCTFKHGLRFHNQLFQSLISKCVLNRQKKGKKTHWFFNIF